MNTGGLWVALATPFSDSGDVDRAAFVRLVEHTVKGGVDTLVVLGSTGEAATLDEAERDTLIELCLAHRGTAEVVVGTGHNSTAQAARWTKRAQQLGAHGALVVTPYYNKPMPAGMVAHYTHVADSAPGLPIAAYNVPGRTGINLAPATAAQLWRIESVVALKESSGNLGQIDELARELPEGKALLAGDDHLALPSIAVGASGLVSVVANLLPDATLRLVQAALAGDIEAARSWQRRLAPTIEALFVESNPIPLKAGLAHLGLAKDHCRLPLTRPTDATRARLVQALNQSELVGRSAPR
ncbi:MAG: 4-hydroxy-tetrahydrodipicolinate synthase [Planctomycetaceae bacterium]|nr:4-hydroxy-tetrahydrodipicolinate synthase [Planctomycetaceae bacterium]